MSTLRNKFLAEMDSVFQEKYKRISGLSIKVDSRCLAFLNVKKPFRWFWLFVKTLFISIDV